MDSNIAFTPLNKAPAEINPAPFETNVLTPPDTSAWRIKHSVMMLGVRSLNDHVPAITLVVAASSRNAAALSAGYA